MVCDFFHPHIGSTPVKQILSSVVPSESSPAVAVNFNIYTLARLCKYFLTIGNHKNHGEKDTTHYDKNTCGSQIN